MSGDDTDAPNVFRLGSVKGGKDGSEAEAIPETEYVIVTKDNTEYFATGFLLFTSQHIAVMRDTGAGALPILVVPLTEVKMAEIVEIDEDEEDEIPF